MTDAFEGPIYLTAEAVLELDELKAGVRSDLPSLERLFHVLQTPLPSPTFEGRESVSMLGDVRSYTVLRNALGESRTRKVHTITEFQTLIDRYLKDLESGVTARIEDKLTEAKSFCQALSNQLINKQLKEVYQHRERVDSRYISHEAIF